MRCEEQIHLETLEMAAAVQVVDPPSLALVGTTLRPWASLGAVALLHFTLLTIAMVAVVLMLASASASITIMSLKPAACPRVPLRAAVLSATEAASVPL